METPACSTPSPSQAAADNAKQTSDTSTNEDGSGDAGPSSQLAIIARLAPNGLANGQLWESRGHGDSWMPMALQGDALSRLLAPVAAE